MSRKTPEETSRGGSGERAATMRADLAARSEAEQLLSEASQARRQAAIDADRIIDEAQTLAAQLTSEARDDAEETKSEAEERAEVITSRARKQAADTTASAESEAEETRIAAEKAAEQLANDIRTRSEAEVRARIDALESHSDRIFAQMNASFDALRAALGATEGAVDEAVSSISTLRTQSLADGAAAAAAVTPAVDETPTETVEVVEAEVTEDEAPAAEVEPATDAWVVTDDQDEDQPAVVTASRTGGPQDARPLGWLFRSADN